MADAKIIATIERSDTEQLQISISEYKGRSYLNMRIFYTTDDGATWLPTKKGVTFAPEQIDLLEEAIQEAKKEFMEEEQLKRKALSYQDTKVLSSFLTYAKYIFERSEL